MSELSVSVGHPFYHCVQSRISKASNGERMSELFFKCGSPVQRLQSMISKVHKGEKTIILPLSVDYICCCCMSCIMRQLTKRDTLSFSEEGKIDSDLKHRTSCHCRK